MTKKIISSHLISFSEQRMEGKLEHPPLSWAAHPQFLKPRMWENLSCCPLISTDINVWLASLLLDSHKGYQSLLCIKEAQPVAWVPSWLLSTKGSFCRRNICFQEKKISPRYYRCSRTLESRFQFKYDSVKWIQSLQVCTSRDFPIWVSHIRTILSHQCKCIRLYSLQGFAIMEEEHCLEN